MSPSNTKNTLRGKSPLLDSMILPESNASETIQSLADMRWMSNSAGVVYEAQVSQLQKLAKLTFSPDVAVISISQESQYVKVESSGKENKITAKFPDIVKYILGDGWTVQMCYDVKDVKYDSPETRKQRNNPKSTGKSRTGAARKKQRTSVKSKNKR